jgi:hypothetical protein
MAYGKRIVLKCPSGYQPSLDQLVEDFLRDRVDLVAVGGRDCAKVEDIIDELVVGFGADPTRFLVTTSHESLEEAIEYANSWSTEVPGEVQVVEI